MPARAMASRPFFLAFLLRDFGAPLRALCALAGLAADNAAGPAPAPAPRPACAGWPRRCWPRPPPPRRWRFSAAGDLFACAFPAVAWALGEPLRFIQARFVPLDRNAAAGVAKVGEGRRCPRGGPAGARLSKECRAFAQ